MSWKVLLQNESSFMTQAPLGSEFNIQDKMVKRERERASAMRNRFNDKTSSHPLDVGRGILIKFVVEGSLNSPVFL